MQSTSQLYFIAVFFFANIQQLLELIFIEISLGNAGFPTNSRKKMFLFPSDLVLEADTLSRGRDRHFWVYFHYQFFLSTPEEGGHFFLWGQMQPLHSGSACTHVFWLMRHYS